MLPFSGSLHFQDVQSMYLTTNTCINTFVCIYTYVHACMHIYVCVCVKTVCIGSDHQFTEVKSSVSQNVTCSYSLNYIWTRIQALS